MDDYEQIIILYDYYGELFNDKQRQCFEEYYFNNFSLAEIAINEDKSRNAIHKIIKGVVNKLYEYEDKLGLYRKDTQLKKIIEKIDDNETKKELEGLLWKINCH